MVNETEEKLELLRREEIRTMAKDIKGLRETESDVQREKMATIGPRDIELGQLRKREEEAKEILTRIKRKTEAEKGIMPKRAAEAEGLELKPEEVRPKVLPKEEAKPKVIFPKGKVKPEAVLPKEKFKPEVVSPKEETRPGVILPKEETKPEVIFPKRAEQRIAPVTIKEVVTIKREGAQERLRMLEEKRLQLEQNLEQIVQERRPLQESKNQYLAEIENLRGTVLKPILEKEGGIEKEKRTIEEEEKGASAEQKRAIEEARWKIEQTRKEVEQERWQAEDQIEEKEKKIKEIDLKLTTLAQKEAGFRDEIDTILMRIKGREMRREGIRIKKELDGIVLERQKLEPLLAEMMFRKKVLEKSLNEIVVSEQALEQEVATLEKNKEDATASQRREIEKKLWEIGEERRKTEEEKWKNEEEKKKLEFQIRDSQAKLEKIKAQQKELEEKKSVIDDFFRRVGAKVIEEIEAEAEMELEIEQPPSPPKAEPKVEPKVEEKKVVEVEPAEPQIERPPISIPKTKPWDGRLPKTPPGSQKKVIKIEDFIPREEIWGRPIPRGKPPLPSERKEAEAAREMEPGQTPKIYATIPKKPPSPVKKFLVRFIIVASCLALIAGFIWFLFGKKFAAKKPEIVPQPPSGPEITVPPSLITVAQTLTFEITEKEKTTTTFEQALQKEMDKDTFARVVIKNTKEVRLASPEEASPVFQFDVPTEIYQKVDPGYTLAIFSQKEGKRTALVTKIKEKEQLNALLKSWETKVAAEGLSFNGKKVQTSSAAFKTASLDGISFRYLGISGDDRGVYYAVLGNYFILTNSFESIKKIINELKVFSTPSLKERFGQLFIIGFEGKTVTPKIEQIFAKYKPGGVLLHNRNIENHDQLKALIADLQDLSLRESGFPLLVAVDQEGAVNRVDFLSEKTSEAEIKNSQDAYRVGKNRANELKELGININLAPVLDDMKSGDFYYYRAFQKKPEVAGELAKSLILGQKESGVLTAIKHFPGYVAINFDPKSKLATVSLPEISQFKKAMEAGPELIMTSSAIYPEIDTALPFNFSSNCIQFLKNNVGSNVMIISDDLAQTALLDKFSLNEIVRKPIEAGVDILIFSGFKVPVEQGLDAFLSVLDKKEISEQKMIEAVSKVLEFKKQVLKY